MDKLKAFWEKLNQDWKDIWNQDKVFFFLFGAVILVIKFRNILIDILLANAKDDKAKADKKNEQLQNEENKANEQANALVQQAQQEPSKEKPVDENWYKKES